MSFAEYFQAITGNAPFPWQQRLFDEFVQGRIPSTANIPTGLGKTCVVVIWLIALALHPEKMPRRLVYVVNRRTVVDQTTTEVENIRTALAKPELAEVHEALTNLCALPLPKPKGTSKASPLAISTLRGQFADNQEWSGDPTRPAVIIGTVDMIGSGLLFSRYTVGFKLRPHHAAFLAQNALLVHDEAHLEPAFQTLLNSIVVEQLRSNDPHKLRVMELSATTRSDGLAEPFKITKYDEENSFIKKRLHAVKKLSLISLEEGEKEQDKIMDLALSWADKNRAVLIFVCSVDAATQIADQIAKKVGVECVLTLTGTMRGEERDKLVRQPHFERFLPDKKQNSSAATTVWLVATSAGEVGVNFSANEMICDLSSYESMAQRLGRLNRFGECADSTVTVVCPAIIGKKDKQGKITQTEMDTARERTLALLQKLNGDACPAALERLNAAERLAAFSPPPQMRTATAIQFDAWALTSIRKPIAARPPVSPFLHGEDEWQPSETHIAWRDDPEIIKGLLLEAYPPEDLLDDFPLKPHELLRDTSKRIAETLSSRIEKYIQGVNADETHRELPPAWLISESGTTEIFPLISSDELHAAYMRPKQNKDNKELIKNHKRTLEDKIANAILILPSCLAGISTQGLFDSDAKEDRSPDVAGIDGVRFRLRSSSSEVPAEHATAYRLVRVIDTLLYEENEKGSSNRYWLWLAAKKDIKSPLKAETLADHTEAVVSNVAAIAGRLFPNEPAPDEPNLYRCLCIAARLHDTGKDRQPWQRGIGNTAYDPAKPETILAKSDSSMRQRNLSQKYRHEFGALGAADAHLLTQDEFVGLTEMERDVVLHLVATHHGRARPHFPVDEVFDYSCSPDVSMALATEVPLRFGRLQQKFGRWGLVWLESILRSADYAASAGIIADNAGCASLSGYTTHVVASHRYSKEVKSVSIRVDVANPGHYFACCGLFELADRINPGILAHFEQDIFTKQWKFILDALSGGNNKHIRSLSSLLEVITSAEIVPLDLDDPAKSAINIGKPFNIIIDWWRYESREIGKLKTWAGQMNVCSIANDMKQALNTEMINHDGQIDGILFISSMANSGQPYYFDANYAVNAQAQDVGFSIDKLNKGGVNLKTVTAPAVEFLSLVGLQRARPVLVRSIKSKERMYEYCVWTKPLPVSLVPAAMNGFLLDENQRYKFANPSRAKDYRAFLPAILL